MRISRLIARTWLEILSLAVFGVIFVVRFIFILLTAAKTQQEAALFEFSLPSEFRLYDNLREVIEFGDYRVLLALLNSSVITVGSVVLIVLLSAGVAFVLQRRKDRVASIVNTIMLAGLIIPPAVVPTIFVLQEIQLYKTLFGLIMVEVAIQMPFAILIFRAFIATIPREIDEAAIVDGASPMQVFLFIILPLLRPAIITVVVVSAVTIYNDFTLPLYFLPGAENVTAQVTLFSFISQFSSRWNLLFADVIIVSIPPLIMYIFFQRQIVSGLTSGAVKG
jgi:raffinose/stachyose/melibiose transport system permease protein